jgi:hypothetical protein
VRQLGEYPPWAPAAVHGGGTVQLVKHEVGGAIAIGVCLLLAWALVRGRNLARFAFAAVLVRTAWPCSGR